jgi:hypothetical protein
MQGPTRPIPRIATLASVMATLASVMLVTAGCMAVPTATAGTAAPALSGTGRQMALPQAAGSTRRGVPEATAAVSAWLAFEAGSRRFERDQVPSADAPPGATATPAPAATAAPTAAGLAAPALPVPAADVGVEAGLVAAGAGGVDNADGTVTLTVTRSPVRPEGPATETLTLTYQKATRRPITLRHRLTVTVDGRALVNQSRSKVWQPDGRFTESVSLSGYDQAVPGSQSPWRMDATTQGGTDGEETTIGTLRRSDGSTLTVRRTRSAGQTRLEVTDSRQNLTLSGSADNSADVRALTLLIDGQPNGSVEVAPAA